MTRIQGTKQCTLSRNVVSSQYMEPLTGWTRLWSRVSQTLYHCMWRILFMWLRLKRLTDWEYNFGRILTIEHICLDEVDGDARMAGLRGSGRVSSHFSRHWSLPRSDRRTSTYHWRVHLGQSSSWSHTYRIVSFRVFRVSHHDTWINCRDVHVRNTGAGLVADRTRNCVNSDRTTGYSVDLPASTGQRKRRKQ